MSQHSLDDVFAVDLRDSGLGTRTLMFEPSGAPSTGDQGPVDHVPSTAGVELA